MARMPIYGKNPSKIFSRTGRLISTKLGMSHRGLQSVIVCSNDDPRVTFTYFTARSNLVTYVFLWEKVKTVDFSETVFRVLYVLCFIRQRYHVSVYRTIGPLVFSFISPCCEKIRFSSCEQKNMQNISLSQFSSL